MICVDGPEIAGQQSSPVSTDKSESPHCCIGWCGFWNNPVFLQGNQLSIPCPVKIQHDALAFLRSLSILPYIIHVFSWNFKKNFTYILHILLIKIKNKVFTKFKIKQKSLIDLHNLVVLFVWPTGRLTQVWQHEDSYSILQNTENQFYYWF